MRLVRVDDDRVAGRPLRLERDVGSGDPAAVRGAVLDGERLRLALVEVELLRAGERGRVRRRLHLALRAEPGTDVEDHRAQAEQAREHHGREHDDLAALALHSTRSVTVVESRPDLTTRPSSEIE